MSPDEEWKKDMKGGQALIEQGADVNALSPIEPLSSEPLSGLYCKRRTTFSYFKVSKWQSPHMCVSKKIHGTWM